VGDLGSLGACRLACGKCKVCRAGDLDCYNRNRKQQGYLQLTVGCGFGLGGLFGLRFWVGLGWVGLRVWVGCWVVGCGLLAASLGWLRPVE